MRKAPRALHLFAAVAGAITIYAWVIRYLLGTGPAPETLAFEQSAWIFWLYTLATFGALLLGPAAIIAAVDEKRPHHLFNLMCLISAWFGVGVGRAIGPDGYGGASMLFYWWGLAFVWTFLIAGSYLFARQTRYLAMRDWTVYGYALSWLPAMTIISFPVWQAISDMSVDEAMITSVTMPFAGSFVLAHWCIIELLD